MDFINFILGIIASITATILVAFFKSSWLMRIKPFIENFYYSKDKIDGRWIGRYSDDIYDDEIVEIKQKSNIIYGKIQSESGQEYDFNGRIDANIILLNYYIEKDNNHIDSGSITLLSNGNNSKLEGYCTLFDEDSNKIEAHKYTLEKQK